MPKSLIIYADVMAGNLSWQQPWKTPRVWVLTTTTLSTMLLGTWPLTSSSHPSPCNVESQIDPALGDYDANTDSERMVEKLSDRNDGFN